MARREAETTWHRAAFFPLFVLFFWLAHAIGYMAHEYCHSFTAWAFGFKANPFALDYGHLDWSNVLMQGDIDENVDYAPIFAAGRGAVASLIAVSGVLIGNGVFYLVSLYGYLKAKRLQHPIPAMFLFLLSIMNVGNLIGYVPGRTFATHADMATVEQGLRISPTLLALGLGIPFCIAVAHFVLKVVPDAMRYFFPDSRVLQLLLLSVASGMIFAFYGSAGLQRYGPISHAISMAFLCVGLPFALMWGWIATAQSRSINEIR